MAAVTPERTDPRTGAVYDPDVLWPAAISPRLRGAFSWWIVKMLRRSFHAVRVARGSAQALVRHDAPADGPAPRPLIVAMNHQSWWDPLVGMYLWRRLLPGRTLLGPMELRQLRTFAFMRRVALFGIEPDHPAALGQMLRYVGASFARDPSTVFWLTPQGRFVDVRQPVRVRPGAGAVAARLGGERGDGVDVVSVAVEYWFGLQKRPEILIRCHPIVCDRGTTIGWTRALNEGMSANAGALARLVVDRDEGAFETLLGGGNARINPLYDLWLRARGRSGAVRATRR